MKSFFTKSRFDNTTLDTARVLGVKKKPLGLVLAMTLLALLLPLGAANATPPYTVTYAGNGNTGGTPPTAPNVSEGDSITVSGPGSLVKAGYTFAGWDDQDDVHYSGGEVIAAPATNVTFTASWVAGPTKTVTYNGNTSTGGTAPTVQTSPIGSSVTISANTFTKTGYDFVKWNTQAGGGGTDYSPSASYTIPGTNTTLYAIWAAHTYNITYNANGGTGAPSPATWTYGTPAASITGTPTKVGYVFLGWTTTINNAGTIVSTYSTAADVTVYALWSGTYNITYDVNGATSGSYSPTTFTYGDTPTALNNGSAIAKTSYHFGGWTTVLNNPGTIVTTNQTTGDITLHALWLPNSFNVTYTAGTGVGTPPSQSPVAFGDTFTVASDDGLTKAGYHFVNWDWGTPPSKAAGATFTMPNHNITFVAQWAANSNAVTYALGGGTGTVPSQDDVATDATFSVAPSTGITRSGYTFDDWYDGTSHYDPSDLYTMGISPVTLTATWTHDENTYSVTYEPGSGTGTSYTETGTATHYYANSNTFTKTGYVFTGWSGGISVGHDYDLLAPLSVTLTAQWSHDEFDYGVTYSPNGAPGSSFEETGTATGFTFAANPFTYAGRTFLGWGTSSSGPVVYGIGDEYDLLGIATGFNVYAIWEHNLYPYAITYDPGSGVGTPYTETGTATGFSFPGQGSFSKPGYSFDGWSGGHSSGSPYDLTDTTTATYYAQWTHNPYDYHVTYSPGAGSGTAHTTDSSGTSFTVDGVSPFSYTGYTFAYWQNGLDTYTPGQVVDLLDSATVTLTAIWTHNSYTYSVSYEPGAGSGSMSTDSGTATSFTLSANTFTRVGYVFDGWLGSNSTSYTNSQVIDLLDSLTVTLTAQWALGTYTITYDSNSALSGYVPSSEYITGDTATVLSANSYIKPGSFFRGWTTTPNDWGTHVTELSPTSDVTVYAFWSDHYSITYDSNTATSADSPGFYTDDIYSYGNTEPFIIENEGELFHKTNYTFIGWGTTPEAPLHYNQTPTSRVFQVTPTADITLYALWSHVTRFYQITYASGGGSGTMPIQTGNTDYLTLNSNTFTRAGYTFDHWSANIGGPYNNSAIIDLTGTFVRTLTAVWTANTYNISYNLNGGTADTATVGQTFTSGGGSTTLLIGSTYGIHRAGYSFGGWKAGNTGSPVSSYSSFADVTMYAYWIPDTFDISYNGNGSTDGSQSPSTYASGDSATALTIFSEYEKTGYDFGGWTTVASDSSTIVTEIGPITANTVVYAYWTPHTYTIHYDSNTSTGGSVPSNSTYTTEDGPTTLSGNTGSLAKIGYDFSGWTLNPGDTETVTTVGPITEDTTVYAHWTPHTYTITYDTNTGTSGSVPGNDYYTTEQITPTVLAGNTGDLAKVGYDFDGWSLGASDTATVELVGPITSDTTVYAQWTPHTYTITYDTTTAPYSGTSVGSVSPNYTTYTTEDDPTSLIDDPELSNSGYAFGGWTTVPGDTTTVVDSLGPITSAATVYALWLPVYTITYDTTTATSGLLDPSTDEYIYTDDPTELIDASTVNAQVHKLHYTFGGWTLVPFDTSTFVTSLEISSDTTVYAYWNLALYHIHYNVNGGTGSIADGEYTSGDAATTLSNGAGLTKIGFNFAGWTTTPNNAGTAISTYASDADVTVYAFWVAQPPANNTGGDVVVANPAPTVTAISPNTGVTTGGQAVTISGTNFISGAVVAIGGAAATGVVFVNSTTIAAVTPVGTVGVKSVVVTNPDAQFATGSGLYTYTAPVVVPPVTAPAPTVTAISPATGVTTGGQAVTITGTNFVTGATVTIGGVAATGVVFGSATSLTAVTPAGTVGVKNVVVTNPDAQSGTGTALYTYTAPVVNPPTGGPGNDKPVIEVPTPPTGGSDTVVIGTTDPNGDPVTVTVGDTDKPGVTAHVDTTGKITVDTPPGFSGKIKVPVTADDGKGGTTTTFVELTINPAPIISGEVKVSAPPKKIAKNTLVKISQVFTVDLPAGAKGYQIIINGKAQPAVATNFTTAKVVKVTITQVLGPDDKVEIVVLGNDGTKSDPTEVEISQAPVSLANVNFASNSSVLDNNAKALLNSAAWQILAHGFTKIDLYGYVDSQGNDAANKVLAAARAATVKAYLAKKLADIGAKGITITSKGFLNGAVGSNATAAGRALTVAWRSRSPNREHN
ncbi:MAG: InlB B-repeat-containing protein [Actinomycetota bacterium]